MPRTKTKPSRPMPSARPPVTVASPVPDTSGEVLTLAEAAAYLRVAEADLRGLIGADGIPGRRVGGEWRFLKSALQDWLRTPPRKSSKEAILSVAGSWKDHPDLDELLKEIYRQRGRPMTEEGE